MELRYRVFIIGVSIYTIPRIFKVRGIILNLTLLLRWAANSIEDTLHMIGGRRNVKCDSPAYFTEGL